MRQICSTGSVRAGRCCRRDRVRRNRHAADGQRASVQHNFILLGLRGQAKSGAFCARSSPASTKRCRSSAQRDINRQSVRPDLEVLRATSSPRRATTRRSPGSGARTGFVEKLATPTSTDRGPDSGPPIRSAPRAAHTCCPTELTIHYGMLRARTAIFAMNAAGSRRQSASRIVNVMPGGPISQIKAIPFGFRSTFSSASPPPEGLLRRAKNITPLKIASAARSRRTIP